MGKNSIKIFIFSLFFILAQVSFSPVVFAKTVVPVALIKILLVPGHDNDVWGAQYKTTKEADMNLAVATGIYNILKKDKRFEVYITRDKNGYTKEFADYFEQHKAEVAAFKENAKVQMNSQVEDGTFTEKANTPHNNVSEDIALRLYGFNKWANDNKMDAVIHIHFNDYPRATAGTVGKYKGFAIYFPDGEFVNSFISSGLAADVYSALSKKYISSTYEPEVGGLVPEQKLIAIGANGTLNASVRSILIEYSYIYEKMFRKQSTRLLAYKNMAALTATGIQRYFFSK